MHANVTLEHDVRIKLEACEEASQGKEWLKAKKNRTWKMRYKSIKEEFTRESQLSIVGGVLRITLPPAFREYF